LPRDREPRKRAVERTPRRGAEAASCRSGPYRSLPLSWLTGFFGQNFDFEVRHISDWGTFVALGLGAEIVTLAMLLAFFKRRDWF
jgi:hypothetical protein